MKLKLETGFYFLIIILVVLIALSIVLFFSLQTDEVAAVLESNQPLNILFILDGVASVTISKSLGLFPTIKSLTAPPTI